MYDKAAYIRGIIERDLDYYQALLALDESTGILENSRNSEARELAYFLKQALFYLRSAKTPGGISPEDFPLLRPLVAHLVKKGNLKPEALDDFG